MLKETSYYTALLTDYINGAASKEQLNELLDFIRDYPAEYETIVGSDEMFALVSSKNEDPDIIITTAAASRMRQRLLDGINGEAIQIKPRVIPIWRRIAAAAAILLLLSVAGYFLLKPNKQPVEIAKNTPAFKTDIPAPATNKARITLANGTTVSIDSINNGMLAMQGNMKVVKNANGEITYEQTTDNGLPSIIAYNTLFNPRGSKAISLTLSDGSQVWLNAESSLKYPTSFTGNEREVEITGEAYFEIAKLDLPGGKRMPFKVTKGTREIEVLGTHFNVNAYDDEDALKVTLLEGSVKVSITGNDQQSTVIKPGQQAIITTSGQLTANNSVDIEAVMAWKNGLFHFNSATLPEVLRQLARWYDVEVTYEGTIPDMKFGGEITRNTNLSQVLQILEESKVHFKIEGKKIVVLR
jgi:transmembrane sensor